PASGLTGALRWWPGTAGDKGGINVAEVIFYEHPVPLNRADHKDLRLKNVAHVKFAMNTHSVPLTGPEFGLAARDLLIVFAGTDAASAGPIALLGLRENENLYVDEAGQWEKNVYIPAFVRRYPFVLAEKPAGQEGNDFTGFLDEFQQNIENTRRFMQQLVKHDLLEPRNVQLHKGEAESGRGITLNGLFMISEEKLRALDEKVTHELLREGVLGWAYAHLLSLANIDRLAQRLNVREQAEPAAGASKN